MPDINITGGLFLAGATTGALRGTHVGTSFGGEADLAAQGLAKACLIITISNILCARNYRLV